METYSFAGREVKLKVPPAWDGKEYMVYIEDLPEGGSRVMVFLPESDEEVASARRFYGEANYVRWRTPEELAQLFDGAGPWVVRLNMCRQYKFLNTTDAENRFEGDEDALFFHSDPQGAVLFSRADAERMVLHFTRHFCYGPEPGVYVEPVPADDLLRHYAPADPVAYALELLAKLPPKEDGDEEVDEEDGENFEDH
jgi:hypothetical protein